MDMSKFLTEIRKIIREEINIALDEITKKTDQRIVEVLKKRLVETKTQPVQKSKPSASGITKTDKDLIREVKASLNGKSNGQVRPQSVQKQPTRSREELLPESLKSLPPTLREALAKTTEDIITGNSPRIGGDIGGSYIPEVYDVEMTEGAGMYDDYDTAISMTTSNVAETMPTPAMNTTGMPDFLASAISKAGKVAKRAEEFSKGKVG